MKERLLLFSDCTFFAGCENMIANLLNHLPRAKYEIAFCYRPSEEYDRGLAKRVVSEEFTAYPIRTPNLERLSAQVGMSSGLLRKVFWPFLAVFVLISTFVEVAYRLRKFSPTIVHVNNGGYPGAFAAYAIVLYCLLKPRRPLVYVVNNIASRRRDLNVVEALLDWVALQRVSRFVTGSAAARTALQKRVKGGLGKYQTIHNGVELRASSESTPLEPAVHDRIGSARQKGQLVVTVVANLEKRKGHVVLFDALSEFRHTYGTAILPLVVVEGSGAEQRSLERKVRDLDLSPNVYFVERVANVMALIRETDVVVLPSIGFEDFPNIILEAMMSGRPVIATRIAGIPEQIDHMTTGILVNPGDPVGLADAIYSMVTHREKVLQMGTAARTRYESNFTAHCAVENYMRLYERLTVEQCHD